MRSKNGLFNSGRTAFMATQKRITVNTKISEEESEKLNSLAERENISVSALIKLFVRALIDGEITIEKGELKTCPTHDEYCICESLDELYRYRELGFDQVIKCFEKHKYPDHEIRRQTGMMIDQISNHGNFNPKRASEDWA